MAKNAQQVVDGVCEGSSAFLPREEQFTHLHLHSEYSLLDGGNRLDKLVARVKELGMDAVAVTDHGNLHGAANFYQIAKREGVKPILGVEAYVCPPGRPRQDRTYTGVSDGGFHLVLLAMNTTGWENLLVLCSEAYLTGFYYKPRIDRELLEKHSEGLIAINGHLGSEMGDHLLAFERSKETRHWDAAVESARWHARVFGPDERGEPRFYVELQHHIDEQISINPHLIRIAEQEGLEIVCDNDSHFLREEDHDAHDTLICISMGKLKHDEGRLKYPHDLYVKSPQQMRGLFESEYGEIGKRACDNTVKIAERCNVELPIGENHAPYVIARMPRKGELPKPGDACFAGDLTAWYKAYCRRFELEPFDPSTSEIPEAKVRKACDECLRTLCEAGVVWRYGVNWEQERDDGAAIRARLERELAILCDKKISAYFLIVWDFVNWGRQRGIPAMARGSGVGTMVGYVLGLSNACPVRYGLLFERFTDPDRSEYPDIDIDLCQDGRAEVIDFVRRKYGHVAQIITFGTLKARAAIRDVSRVLNISLPAADRIAKLIPDQLNITLDDALEQEPDLRAIYEGGKPGLDKLNKDLGPGQSAGAEQVRTLIDNARVLEGQARHASVHAAGVIVATRPLHEIVPLYKQSGAGEHEIVTQWDGPTCEKFGLLKMDFLGLRTLSVIERAKQLIREGLDDPAVYRGVGRDPGDGGPHPLDLERLTYDDPRVFSMFQRGDTTGVFQFESPGMRRLLLDMKPDRLEDLIAANALFRPGPMDLIPDYNRRKHGEAEVPRVHPIVDGFTRETYGVMVYQEQVMQIVHGLGGIPLRGAYTLIKAISKKKAKVIDEQRPRFIQGAVSNGLAKKDAEGLFDLILKFAGYGFNKSHSTGYAIVAYQTAYLKTYFPNQYLAAFLTFESRAQKVSDWIAYLEDCKNTRFVGGKVGVEVKPPDVNLSESAFSVVFDRDEPREAGNGHIRFGIGAIKGVGEKAIQTIIRERDGGDDRERKPFESLHDFCERVLGASASGSGGAVLNKSTVEALVKCGAMDCLHGRERRAAMLGSIESAMSSAQRELKDKAAGQGGLFAAEPTEAGDTDTTPAVRLSDATPWSESETLANEKSALGFYVSSHPLATWSSWTGVFTTGDCSSIRQMGQDQRVVLAGLVQSVRTRVTQRGRSAGQKMAIVTFEDLHTTVEGVLFSDAYNLYSHLLEEDKEVFVLGRLDWSRSGGPQNANQTANQIGDQNGAGDAQGAGTSTGGVGGAPQLIVERLVPIDGVPLLPGKLWLRVDADRLNGGAESALARAAEVVRHAASASTGAGVNGSMPDTTATFPVGIVVETKDRRVCLSPGLRGEHQRLTRVALGHEMASELTGLLGEGCLRVEGGKTVEQTNAGDRNGYRHGGQQRRSGSRSRAPSMA